jgi:DNA alkylation damage repair protein AlkB
MATEAAQPIEHIAPGAVLARARLTLDQQAAVAQKCFDLGAADAAFYTPIVRGGHPMSVKMLCLGRHWNAKKYCYEPLRSDVDGLPAPRLPSEFADFASAIARDAGFEFTPDLCIINWYTAASRMGLHQDKDESAETIQRGVPVVSVSVGDTANFLFGGMKRRDPVQKILLASGDAFVFGGGSRLRYHGVSSIVAGSSPPSLAFAGRLNLTFRQF